MSDGTSVECARGKVCPYSQSPHGKTLSNFLKGHESVPASPSSNVFEIPPFKYNRDDGISDTKSDDMLSDDTNVSHNQSQQEIQKSHYINVLPEDRSTWPSSNFTDKNVILSLI